MLLVGSFRRSASLASLSRVMMLLKLETVLNYVYHTRQLGPSHENTIWIRGKFFFCIYRVPGRFCQRLSSSLMSVHYIYRLEFSPLIQQKPTQYSIMGTEISLNTQLPAQFYTIPDEILLSIIRHLDRRTLLSIALLICKRINRMCIRSVEDNNSGSSYFMLYIMLKNFRILAFPKNSVLVCSHNIRGLILNLVTFI